MPGGVNLEQIQEYMRMQSEQDKKNRTITVEAENVQEGLKKASIELGIPVSGLEYEIVARGSAGTFGIGRTPWKISVYERSKQVKTSSEAAEEAAREAETQRGGCREAQGPSGRGVRAHQRGRCLPEGHEAAGPWPAGHRDHGPGEAFPSRRDELRRGAGLPHRQARGRRIHPGGRRPVQPLARRQLCRWTSPTGP